MFGASSSMASGENRQSCHHMTFGADLVFFGGAIWYTTSATARSSRSEDSFFAKWGPVIFVVMGCVFLICDPIRHLVLDHGGFGMERQLAMYNDDGGLSSMGLASKRATHLGVLLLSVGLLWFVGAPEKFSKLFRPRALPV